MAKKVIQVPVDAELLKSLDSLSKKQRKARSELIRQACSRYLQQIENEELDKVYQEAYIRMPEEPKIGEVQIAISGESLSKESW